MFKIFRRSETPASPTPVQLIARDTDETRSLADADFFTSVFGASPSISGVPVGPRTACRVPAVRAAIAAVSEACGQLPLQIVETDSTGQRRAIREHPLHDLLNGNANGWTPASYA